MDVYCLPLNEIHSDLDLRILFDDIPSRSVLVFEDIDSMGQVVKDRAEKKQNFQLKDEKTFDEDGVKIVVKNAIPEPEPLTLSNLLNLIDGIACAHGRIIVMTTNHPDKIDPALLRPGRCDLTIELRHCDRYQIAELYKLYFEKDISESDLQKFDDGQLTPAQVTSTFLTHRLYPETAINILRENIKQK